MVFHWGYVIYVIWLGVVWQFYTTKLKLKLNKFDHLPIIIHHPVILAEKAGEAP
jgi:hypothetical protein